MKKIFSFAVLFAALSMVACGGEQPKAEEAEEVAVEEVVVEEAPAVEAPAAPAAKAEKEVTIEEKLEEVVETTVQVANSGLSVSADAKKDNGFKVTKEVKKLDESAKVGNATISVAGEGKVDKASITVTEGANLQVNTNGEGAKLTIKK